MNFMERALELAQMAYKQDEVPVGCVIVLNDKIIGEGFNQKESNQSPLDHAEIVAIKEATQYLQSWRLEGCDLYVTLEPCAMCAGAILQARINRVIFGAFDPKGGCFGSVFDITQKKGFNHYPQVIAGVLAEESKNLLQQFFREKREKGKKNL